MLMLTKVKSTLPGDTKNNLRTRQLLYTYTRALGTLQIKNIIGLSYLKLSPELLESFYN